MARTPRVCLQPRLGSQWLAHRLGTGGAAHRRMRMPGIGRVGGVRLLTLAQLGIGGSLAAFGRVESPTATAGGRHGRDPGQAQDGGDGRHGPRHRPGAGLRRSRNCGVAPDGVDDFLAEADLFVDRSTSSRSRSAARCSPAHAGRARGSRRRRSRDGRRLAYHYNRVQLDRSRLRRCSADERCARFLIGLVPQPLAALWSSRCASTCRRRGASTAAAVVVAGVVGAVAVKLLLGQRGEAGALAPVRRLSRPDGGDALAAASTGRCSG